MTQPNAISQALARRPKPKRTRPAGRRVDYFAEPIINVTAGIPERMLDRFNELADRYGRARAAIIRDALAFGIDQAEQMMAEAAQRIYSAPPPTSEPADSADAEANGPHNHPVRRLERPE